MTEQQQTVSLLADRKAEELKEELFNAGQLITAAQEGRIALIIGTHHETGEEGAFICAVNPSEDGKTAGYVPLGLLSTTLNPLWVDYEPPECSIPDVEPGPLDVFEEDIDDEAEDWA